METRHGVFQPQLRKTFNRIYEEWKLSLSKKANLFFKCSIESMRNGNIDSMYRSTSLETSSIESMRNGNSTLPAYRQRGDFVQSNLWGMETMQVEILQFWFSLFNRIYEEWKLRVQKLSFEHSIEFNRIYEEWKQNKFPLAAESDRGSIESMRNGNFWQVFRPVPWSMVQSNLWGMETVTGSKR